MAVRGIVRTAGSQRPRQHRQQVLSTSEPCLGRPGAGRLLRPQMTPHDRPADAGSLSAPRPSSPGPHHKGSEKDILHTGSPGHCLLPPCSFYLLFLSLLLLLLRIPVVVCLCCCCQLTFLPLFTVIVCSSQVPVDPRQRGEGAGDHRGRPVQIGRGDAVGRDRVDQERRDQLGQVPLDGRELPAAARRDTGQPAGGQRWGRDLPGPRRRG